MTVDRARHPARPARSPDVSGDACDELCELERSCETVICTVSERLHARLDGGPRGDREDRHVDAGSAELAQDIEAVSIDQRELEKHEIEIAALASIDRIRPGLDKIDAVSHACQVLVDRVG